MGQARPASFPLFTNPGHCRFSRTCEGGVDEGGVDALAEADRADRGDDPCDAVREAFEIEDASGARPHEEERRRRCLS